MADPVKPPTRVTLTWEGDLRFSSGDDEPALVLDSDSKAGPSPMQALGYAVMACMGMDIVHVLQKGRHPLECLKASMIGTRADEHPRRFTRIEMTFTITGNGEGANTIASSVQRERSQQRQIPAAAIDDVNRRSRERFDERSENRVRVQDGLKGPIECGRVE